MQEEYYKFLDKLEDIGLITQEEGKDIKEVVIVASEEGVNVKVEYFVKLNER